jgi:hypothetical protein
MTVNVKKQGGLKHMCNNDRNIKLTMVSDGEFIRFRTYSRINGCSRTFIIGREKLACALEGQSVVDADCDGFLEVYQQRDNKITLVFYWLSVSTNNDITGYKQMMLVPVDVLEHVVRAKDGVTVKYLYQGNQRRKAIIHADGASKTIRQIQTDKRIKRAFSKALRDHFDWSDDDTVYLFSDGFYDIYFTCEGCWPINGGLILHHYQRNGQDRVVYAVHT